MNRIFDRQTIGGGACAAPRLALLAAVVIAASGPAHAAGTCLYEAVTLTGSGGVVTYQSNGNSTGGTGVCGFFAGLNTSGSQGFLVSPSSMPLGLTSGTLSIATVDSNTFATGTASLESGTVGSVSHSNSTPLTIAAGKSVLEDTVHFTITNGAASAPVTVQVHEDGAWNGVGNIQNGVGFSFGGDFSYDSSDPPFPGQTVGIRRHMSTSVQPSWASFAFTSESGTGFDFNGVFNVTNGQNVPLHMQIITNCQLGAICDFWTCTTPALCHGGRFSLVLPSNVTFTSDSGVLLSSGLPAISVNRKVLNFGVNGSLVTSPQSVLVTLAGGAAAAWTATSDHSNISVNPASGTGTGTFQISASAGSSGIVTVAAPGFSSQTIQVNVASVTPAMPFGSFDTPMNNTTGVVGAIPVTGWALDNIEVTRVDIFREPVMGEPAGPLVFIGTAVFSADARPDVATQFATSPYQNRAGWGYQMLTNFLPNASGSGAPGNGTYKLHAIAFNKAGGQLDLGTKAITVDNTHAAKPFGTLDTPGQGGTTSGPDSVNFGWVLTPKPGVIPIDGSTITVVIDGVSVGHPTYNNFRSDVANLFPGFANSGGAVGFFHINTTTLANGVHTISWNAFDNLGHGEGLGSRYFNVTNTGVAAMAAAVEPIDQSAASQGVRVRNGLDVDRVLDPIAPDGDGGYSVTMEEVGHIELYVGAASGKMLVQDEAQALPTGSTLKDGVFYWQPGPGFLGEYTMQFQRPDGTRILVRVTIVPKRY
jgi:hypothetical protein